MVRIEPFVFQFCTAFRERKQLADKLNEIIDYLNNGGGGGGDIPTDIQEQIDEIKERLDNDETNIETLSNTISMLETTVSGYSSVISDVVESVADLNDSMSTLETTVSGYSSTIADLQEDMSDFEERTYDYLQIKATTTNLRNQMDRYTDYSGYSQRRPVLKLGITYSIGDPYVRTEKDVAFLDDIPQFEKVTDKPVSGSAFLSAYTYEDSNGFKHWNQDIMVVCYMTSGEYKSVGYVCYKDQPLNFGTWCYRESGFDQNSQYVVTEWLLPDTPYSSTMYKTKLTFGNNSVSRTSDLNVSFIWDLYVR